MCECWEISKRGATLVYSIVSFDFLIIEYTKGSDDYQHKPYYLVYKIQETLYYDEWIHTLKIPRVGCKN